MFALPFALTGALLAWRVAPFEWRQILWVIVAMVSARSAAMGFNRLVDARMDALNPRTAMREIPAGLLSRRDAAIFVVLTSAIFVAAAFQLNPLCGVLSPVALAIVFWYSLAKRFTSYTQAFLGLAMAVAPVGGWLAAGGPIGAPEPWLLGLAIGLWVGGFDILYACQDVEFDRAHGLNSIPVRFGVARSLVISRAMHVATIACMAALGAARPARPDLLRRRRTRGGVVVLRAVARLGARSVAGEARLRSQRVGRHPVFRRDGTRLVCPLNRQGDGGPPPDKAPEKISGMFDAIAGRYDLLNTVLSGGLDRYWRRRTIASLQLTGRERLLDVCTGTADVAIGAARRTDGAARVVGVDFSGSMLTHGLEKGESGSGSPDRIQLVRGDAMALPVAGASVDAVTISFGIRNVQRADDACEELLRVLRPGGRLAILEFGLPVFPAVRPLYLWYFNQVLPRIGRAVSRHDAAYTYLPESVGTFQFGDDFARILD